MAALISETTSSSGSLGEDRSKAQEPKVPEVNTGTANCLDAKKDFDSLPHLERMGGPSPGLRRMFTNRIQKEFGYVTQSTTQKAVSDGGPRRNVIRDR